MYPAATQQLLHHRPPKFIVMQSSTKIAFMQFHESRLKQRIADLASKPMQHILTAFSAMDIAYRVRTSTPTIIEYRCDQYGFSGSLDTANSY
jgi:hypothetical protein